MAQGIPRDPGLDARFAGFVQVSVDLGLTADRQTSSAHKMTDEKAEVLLDTLDAIRDSVSFRSRFELD